MKAPSKSKNLSHKECSAKGESNNPRDTTKLPDVVDRELAKSGMSYGTFVKGVTQNAFRSLVVWSEADMERLLVTCEALGLSPLGRDVYAVPSGNGGGVLIAVGVEGWSRIMNQHPQFDGMDFTESPEQEGGVPAWISCTIHRRDRRIPMSVKEYLCEVIRDTSAWKTHPRRMLRHKAMVQCARLAFELPTSSGIYDIDEASHIGQLQANTGPRQSTKIGTENLGGPVNTPDEITPIEDPILQCVANNTHSCREEHNPPNCLPVQSKVIRVRRVPSDTQQLIEVLTRRVAQ